MISNCRGCEIELSMAYGYQSEGYNVALKGMGERKHVFLTVFDKDGNVVLC